MSAEEVARHREWLCERYQEAFGTRPGGGMLHFLDNLVREYRHTLVAEQIARMKVVECWRNENGIRERDIAAEKYGWTVIRSCAAMASGKFGLMPSAETFNGRPVVDVHLPEDEPA